MSVSSQSKEEVGLASKSEEDREVHGEDEEATLPLTECGSNSDEPILVAVHVDQRKYIVKGGAQLSMLDELLNI